jgi:hypothetical protein
MPLHGTDTLRATKAAAVVSSCCSRSKFRAHPGAAEPPRDYGDPRAGPLTGDGRLSVGKRSAVADPKTVAVWDAGRAFPGR